MNPEIRQILKSRYLSHRLKPFMKPWEIGAAQAIVEEDHFRTLYEVDPNLYATGLIDCLVRQGRWSEALDLAFIHSHEWQLKIAAFIEAERSDDDALCSCREGADCPGKGNEKTDRTPCKCGTCPQYIGKVWSERRNRFIDHVVCPKCKAHNFTEAYLT